MTPIQFLYRKSAWIFAGFTVLAIIAFWRNYLGNPFGPHPTLIHFHAVVMFAWCAMLIAQGTLIRTKWYSAHKSLGAYSYGLVALILISGMLVAYDSVSGLPDGSALKSANSALMFHSLIAFAVIYGLAMWNRKDPLTHARYMVATLFPILTPITDRLIFIHLPFLIPYLPLLEGRPKAYPVGFLLADAVLLGLALWDWKRGKRHPAFWVALAIVLAYHASVMRWHL